MEGRQNEKSPFQIPGKRKHDVLDDYEDEATTFEKILRLENETMDEELHSVVSAASAAFSLQKERARRGPNEQRDQRKWDDGYRSWISEKFKRKLRVELITSKCILDEIPQNLVKIPTAMVPYPIPPETQLALNLYCLVYGCSFSTLEDVFGWSVSICDNTFTCVCRVLVARMYDRCVKVPVTDN